MKLGLDGEVIAVMCFELLNNLFTELTVHALVWFLVCLLLIDFIACDAKG